MHINNPISDLINENEGYINSIENLIVSVPLTEEDQFTAIVDRIYRSCEHLLTQGEIESSPFVKVSFLNQLEKESEYRIHVFCQNPIHYKVWSALNEKPGSGFEKIKNKLIDRGVPVKNLLTPVTRYKYDPLDEFGGIIGLYLGYPQSRDKLDIYMSKDMFNKAAVNCIERYIESSRRFAKQIYKKLGDISSFSIDDLKANKFLIKDDQDRWCLEFDIPIKLTTEEDIVRDVLSMIFEHTDILWNHIRTYKVEYKIVDFDCLFYRVRLRVSPSGYNDYEYDDNIDDGNPVVGAQMELIENHSLNELRRTRE